MVAVQFLPFKKYRRIDRKFAILRVTPVNFSAYELIRAQKRWFQNNAVVCMSTFVSTLSADRGDTDYCHKRFVYFYIIFVLFIYFFQNHFLLNTATE